MENEKFYLVVPKNGCIHCQFIGTLQECRQEQKFYSVPTLILKEGNLSKDYSK